MESFFSFFNFCETKIIWQNVRGYYNDLTNEPGSLTEKEKNGESFLSHAPISQEHIKLNFKISLQILKLKEKYLITIYFSVKNVLSFFKVNRDCSSITCILYMLKNMRLVQQNPGMRIEMLIVRRTLKRAVHLIKKIHYFLKRDQNLPLSYIQKDLRNSTVISL